MWFDSELFQRETHGCHGESHTLSLWTNSPGLYKAALEAPPVAGLLLSSEPIHGKYQLLPSDGRSGVAEGNPSLISGILSKFPPTPGLGFCLSKGVAGLSDLPRRWAGSGVLWVTVLSGPIAFSTCHLHLPRFCLSWKPIICPLKGSSSLQR